MYRLLLYQILELRIYMLSSEHESRKSLSDQEPDEPEKSADRAKP